MALLSLGLLLSTICLSITCELVPIDKARYDEGKKQYDLMQRQSEMPKYGKCWKGAVTLIQSDCKHLTDLVQTRLALAYLNCFLQIQGRSKYECDESKDISDCVEDMNEADRSSLTTFFTHTLNMCYFLQAQVWQEGTENTITKLSDTSSQVADQLVQAQKLQQDMLASQNKSLKNQEELIHQTHSLNDIIVNSSQNVKFLFDDLKVSTKEQKQIIGDLFDQLTKIQNTILGEVSGFYSLFYFVALLFVSYLISSTPRTAGSRVWLFLIMTINVIVEQSVMVWINSMYSSTGDNELLYWLQKQCRRVFILMGIVIWLLCVYLYQDINALNNQLLVEIRKQNSDLKKYFTAGQQPAPLKSDQRTCVHKDTEDSTDSDYTSDISDEEASDAHSDRTFILPENKKDDDLDSWVTSHNSELAENELLLELSDLRKDTSLTEPHHRILSWLDEANSSLNISGIQKPQLQSVPAHQATNSGSPYNLRPRKPTNSPSLSPATQVESAKSFSKTVHHMQQITEKNSRLIRAFHQSQRVSPPHVSPLPKSITPSDDRSSVSSRSTRSRTRNSLMSIRAAKS